MANNKNKPTGSQTGGGHRSKTGHARQSGGTPTMHSASGPNIFTGPNNVWNADGDTASATATTAVATPGIAYGAASFAQNAGDNQMPTMNGGVATGGTFGSTQGLTIDPTTGKITPSTSTPGTYVVTYTDPSGNAYTFSVMITASTMQKHACGCGGQTQKVILFGAGLLVGFLAALLFSGRGESGGDGGGGE